MGGGTEHDPNQALDVAAELLRLAHHTMACAARIAPARPALADDLAHAADRLREAAERA